MFFCFANSFSFIYSHCCIELYYQSQHIPLGFILLHSTRPQPALSLGTPISRLQMLGDKENGVQVGH